MPHAENPKGGLLTNWNNKASSWWPNGDTPVWGSIFRVSILRDALQKPKLKISDLENAAWTIARTTEHGSSLYPLVLSKIDEAKLTPVEADALSYLKAFDGRMLDGDQGPMIYNQLFASLQEELFYGSAGNFISEDLFRMVAQPSLVLKAFQGKTLFNYLGSRTQSEVATASFRKACQKLIAQAGNDPGLWRYSCPKILAVGTPPVPYSNRGTYIQLIELRQTPIGRNVVPPGVAESGPHATDQIDLARAWLFKAMGF
jgi:penicillin amidase